MKAAEEWELLLTRSSRGGLSLKGAGYSGAAADTSLRQARVVSFSNEEAGLPCLRVPFTCCDHTRRGVDAVVSGGLCSDMCGANRSVRE